MIQKFIERFLSQETKIKAVLSKAHPANYEALVHSLIEVLTVQPEDDFDSKPDPERIVCIDHGDDQGTLLFIVGETDYQPSTYWALTVNYGSCSGCDTLQSISEYSNKKPTKTQVGEYWTLMLHLLQSMKQI